MLSYYVHERDNVEIVGDSMSESIKAVTMGPMTKSDS